MTALHLFAHPGQQDDFVVHRQAEAEREQQHRQQEFRRASRREAQQPGPHTILEDDDDGAVAGREAQRIQHDGLDGHDHRAERHPQHDAHDQRDDEHHQWHPLAYPLLEGLYDGGYPTHVSVADDDDADVAGQDRDVFDGGDDHRHRGDGRGVGGGLGWVECEAVEVLVDEGVEGAAQVGAFLDGGQGKLFGHRHRRDAGRQ